MANAGRAACCHGAIVEATNVGPLMQHLIRFCVYAGGQRPFEMIASQWSAIDWQQKTLLVIADVSKNKREHLIPMTESALQELASVKELTKESNSPYILPLSTNGVSAQCAPIVWRVPSCISGPLILNLKFSRREIYVGPVRL